MIFCLDTNVLIDVLRNEGAVIAKLRSLEVVAVKIPEVVRAELLVGCLKSAHPVREREKVDHVLAPFEWLPFAGDAFEHYAMIRCDLEKRGAPIGPHDMLIAATARSHGAVMVSSDTAEFSRVQGLVVENWR